MSPSIESVQAGNYGYINKTGKLVIKHQFSKVHSFSQGLAAVKIGEKWGYIDKTGKVVVKPQFSQAYSFFEGIAAVKIGDKSGYVDKTGKQAIRLQFDGDFIAGGNFIYSSEREPGSFSEGLTAVAIKDNDGTIGLGYINKRGQLVIKTEFHELTLSPPSLRYGGRFLLQ